MGSRSKIGLGAGLLLVAVAFFVGRVVEQRALAMNSRALEQRSPASTPRNTPEPTSYRELTASDIIALRFADFYEALRSAPGEAREKWRLDLEKMPTGPRKNAAVAGFYKLLVQFDPVTAAKNACEVDDKELRALALDSVVSAAPGFALKDIATLFLKIATEPYNAQPYLERVISAWTEIDPAAVARFHDEHPEIREYFISQELITAWAAIDPKATTEWLASHNYGPGFLGDYLMGLYLNDRASAIDYALKHADEMAPSSGLSRLLSALYLDSKEQAKKFIERLPAELRHDAFRGLETTVQFGTGEETGDPERTPRAVADWMVQFPSEYWRGHLAEVLDHWNNVPPEEVFSWIEQQPPGIRRDVAAEYKIDDDHAVEVVSALMRYSNTDLRDQLAFALFKNSGSGLTQMKEAIVNSSIPSAQKKYVLEIAAKANAAIEEQEAKERAAADYGSEK